MKHSAGALAAAKVVCWVHLESEKPLAGLALAVVWVCRARVDSQKAPHGEGCSTMGQRPAVAMESCRSGVVPFPSKAWPAVEQFLEDLDLQDGPAHGEVTEAGLGASAFVQEEMSLDPALSLACVAAASLALLAAVKGGVRSKDRGGPA